METTRRDFVKLSLTTAAIAASGFAARELLQIQQTQPVGEIAVPLICGMCAGTCGLLFVRRGDSMYILPNLKHPQPGQCARPSSALQLWDHPLRLKKPLKRAGKRGEGKFQEVDWDAALNEIAAKLREIAERYGPESVVITAHDVHRWFLPVFLTALGSPNLVGHDSTCHYPGTVARMAVFAGGPPPSIDPDYENARYIMFIGRNLNAAMGTVRKLAQAREHGVKIVAVDPRAPNIAYSNVEWVPITPGTDAAFVLSMIHVIISENLYDVSFVKRYTNAPFLIKPDGTPLTEKDLGREGAAHLVYDNAAKQLAPHDKAQDPSLDFEGEVETPQGLVKVRTVFKLLAERAAKYPPEVAEKITGIPAATIVRLARELAIQRGVIEDQWFSAKNGSGDIDGYRAMLILNALLGNIDKRGGLCFKEPARLPTALAAVEAMTGQKLPSPKTRRVDLYKYPISFGHFDAVVDAILEEKPYPIKALFIVATTLFPREINLEKLKKALEKLELIVTIDILPQEHVDWSDYVLPDLMFLERNELAEVRWTLAPAIHISRKALDPPPGVNARHGLWALMEILRRAFPDKAALVGYTEKYADPHKYEEYEEAISNTMINLTAKTWGIKPEDLKTALERDGFYVFKPKTYEVRPYKTPLGTPSGKVEIYSLRFLALKLDPLPDWRQPSYKIPQAPDEFYLVGSKDINTSLHGVFVKNMQWLLDRAVWMNPADAARLGVKDGDLVELESLNNGYKGVARIKITNRVRQGVLFTYHTNGIRSALINHKDYEFIKEGVRSNWFSEHQLTPVLGELATNTSVKVRKL
ncbi:MAG: molybdopterin-dependent oxidoreductase [Pyrobaculum sp.]